MNVFDQTLLTELAQRLGWAIADSLWQGTLVAGLLALALWMVPRRQAAARYATSCFALLTIFGLFVASFLWTSPEVRETTTAGKVSSPIVAGSEVTSLPADVAATVPLPAASAIGSVPQKHVAPPLPPSVARNVAENTPRATWTDRFGAFLPWLAPSWLAGVLLLSFWRLGGWIAIIRLRSLGTARVPDAVVRTLHELARRLGISHPVRVFQSTRAQTPLVIGWFRPVILLPCAVLTGLSPQQIEAILTHELAHIRRHDYLVNLVQTALETLLFHHPAVWWISHRIRAERECCCDDLAVRICGDRVAYARTLATLEEHLAAMPATAIAASAGSLLDRIRRVVGQPVKPQEPRGTWLAGALILIACIVISLRVVSAQGKAEADSPPQEKSESNLTDEELASLPQAVAKRVTDVIENRDLPFMTVERLRGIDAEFVTLVTKYQRNDLNDERKRAILGALENRRHLPLAKHDMRALNTTYLEFPDRIKTLQWKLFMALTRAPLTESQQQRRANQQDWMRNIVTSLPEDRHWKRNTVRTDLESQFRDPLCTPFDRPMTNQQFSKCETAIETYLSEAKTGVEESLSDRSRSIKPHNPLPFVVHHLVYESLKAQYHGEKQGAQFPLFDGDRVGSNGASGGYVHLGFMSNRLFRGGTRALDDVEKGHSVVDATTGYVISAPRESRERGKFRRWLHEHSKGDFGYDDAKGGGLFAVRGAKLVSLDVKNWLEADAVTDDALRALLKKQGTETISLKKYYAAYRDENKTHPPTAFIGPYIGILTKAGRLAVVRVEDFSGPENISYRVRVRQQESQSTAEAEPATISGRIVLRDGSPATVKGWMYSTIHSGEGNSKNISMKTEGNFSNTFSIGVRAGTVWLSHFPENHAPAWLGPLEVKPGEKLEGVTIVLTPGFSQLVRVMNEQGAPVASATLVAHPRINGNTSGPVFEKMTDASGEYLLEHLADTRYTLTITSPGYEPLRTKPLTMQSDKTLSLTLAASKKTTGLVTDADGAPAAGAKLRATCELRQNGQSDLFGNEGDGFWGKVAATTDGKGRFDLDQLARASHYLFVIEAADGARAIVHDLQAGQQDVQIVMPKRLDLNAKITGDLSSLPKRRGKPFVSVRQRVKFHPTPDKSCDVLIGGDTPIERTDDGGTAIFHGIAVDLNPNAGTQQVEVSLNYPNDTSKTIDINPNGVTEVLFQFGEPLVASASDKHSNPIEIDMVADASHSRPLPDPDLATPDSEKDEQAVTLRYKLVGAATRADVGKAETPWEKGVAHFDISGRDKDSKAILATSPSPPNDVAPAKTTKHMRPADKRLWDALLQLREEQARTKEQLPEWLKPLFNAGLVAAIDAQGQVISLTVGEIASDSFLENIADPKTIKTLKTLKTLDLKGTENTTAAGILNLRDLRALEKFQYVFLKSEGHNLGDQVVESLKETRSLRELSLNGSGITDVGATLLESMPWLESLSFYEENRLTDAALVSIAKLKGLKKLEMTYYGQGFLNGSPFGENGLKELGLLKGLEQLSLTGTIFPADILPLPKLKTLVVCGYAVDDAVIKEIAACRKLEYLSLSETRCTDEGLKAIATLPQLNRLSLTNYQGTDEGIAHLKQLKQLEQVELRRSPRLTDKAIKYLSGIKTLTRLDLANPHGSFSFLDSFMGFTVDGVAPLKDLPMLRTLYLTSLKGGRGSMALRKLKQLESLSLMRVDIDAEEIRELKKLLPNTSISISAETKMGLF